MVDEASYSCDKQQTTDNTAKEHCIGQSTNYPKTRWNKKVNPLTNMVCEVNSKLYLTLKWDISEAMLNV